MGSSSLNGGTTEHPLSAHAYQVLATLRSAPRPTSAINPGVVDVLTRKGLATRRHSPSPFPTHRGRSIPHLSITEQGMNYLVSNPAASAR